ncbi:hypothetical protein ACJX0J_009293, partial [Zea mays]
MNLLHPQIEKKLHAMRRKPCITRDSLVYLLARIHKRLVKQKENRAVNTIMHRNCLGIWKQSNTIILILYPNRFLYELDFIFGSMHNPEYATWMAQDQQALSNKLIMLQQSGQDSIVELLSVGTCMTITCSLNIILVNGLYPINFVVTQSEVYIEGRSMFRKPIDNKLVGWTLGIGNILVFVWVGALNPLYRDTIFGLQATTRGAIEGVHPTATWFYLRNHGSDWEQPLFITVRGDGQEMKSGAPAHRLRAEE